MDEKTGGVPNEGGRYQRDDATGELIKVIEEVAPQAPPPDVLAD